MSSDKTRHGTFSSSSAWKLMTKNRKGDDWGEKAVTYVKQVGHERALGRAINKEQNARSTSWGCIAELRVFDILPLAYNLVSNDRLFHPDYSYMSGMPDLKKGTTCADCKAPYSLEVFCDKIAALKSGLATYKSEYPEDYWQHIQNSILLEKNGVPITHFEAIIFCPYKEELEDIRKIAMAIPPEEATKYKWLDYAYDDELPYLLKSGKYQNLNIFSFEVPQADKDALTAAVLKAESLLTPPILIASEISNGVLVERG